MIRALVLGLTQGVMKFIPVSSSAHLRMAGIVLEIEHRFRSLRIIAFTMMMLGALLGIVDHPSRKRKPLEDLGVRSAVVRP